MQRVKTVRTGPPRITLKLKKMYAVESMYTVGGSLLNINDLRL